MIVIIIHMGRPFEIDHCFLVRERNVPTFGFSKSSPYPEPISDHSPFSQPILPKLAGNVDEGKNRIPFFFSLQTGSVIRQWTAWTGVMSRIARLSVEKGKLHFITFYTCKKEVPFCVGGSSVF
jgi:hypothetical protein